MPSRKRMIVPSLAIGPVKRGMERINFQALGLIPGVFGGGPQGYNTEGDIITQTIDGRDLNEIWAELQASMTLQNESRGSLVDLLTFPVQQPVEDVPQGVQADFEEASEFGEPKGIRGPTYFSMAYDFKWYDVAMRYTWKFLADATGAQVENLNNIALEADNRLVFTKVLRAIFNSTTRTANIRTQSYNVYPFYNGDTADPPPYGSYDVASGHNHYLVSGGATVDGQDLIDMEDTLVHHGYGRQAGAQLLLLVNRAQLATIRTFRIATGSPYDFIASAGQPPYLLPTNTAGAQGATPPAQVSGQIVAGVYGNWTIIENDYMPAGYMLGFATGGTLQATNPVGIREHQNAGLRGLRLVKGRTADYPLIDSFYNRGFGTGVRHRGAGVVMQVKASGNYDIPAAYV
jgi:hypothetical protein